MVIDKPPLSAIPTNVITGFLGVGKTTAILNLLKNKPADQRWAVLVNEFGEIGVDSCFFQNQYDEPQGVFIREVPGGCMCCTAGLPMQVALNQLISRARPDRLIIEPSGLGHPREVLEALTNAENSQVLSLQKVVTLIDARCLADSRYTEHQTYNQQLAVADLLIANKQDLYQTSDRDQLSAFLEQKGIKVPVKFVEQGHIDPNWLEGASDFGREQAATSQFRASDERFTLKNQADREQEFKSIGWQFGPDTLFNYTRLAIFLNGVIAERLKAVFITERGVFAFNLAYDALTEIALDQSIESRVEIIATKLDDSWEQQLQDCIEQQA